MPRQLQNRTKRVANRDYGNHGIRVSERWQLLDDVFFVFFLGLFFPFGFTGFVRRLPSFPLRAASAAALSTVGEGSSMR